MEPVPVLFAQIDNAANIPAREFLFDIARNELPPVRSYSSLAKEGADVEIEISDGAVREADGHAIEGFPVRPEQKTLLQRGVSEPQE